jgi:hypothetical protein
MHHAWSISVGICLVGSGCELCCCCRLLGRFAGPALLALCWGLCHCICLLLLLLLLLCIICRLSRRCGS